jgi:hypothetical protein
MEIPLKPISFPHNFTIPPKLTSQSKKPDTETQLRERERETDRQTDRQMERQERAWKVVVVVQTQSKEEKQEGMR